MPDHPSFDRSLSQAERTVLEQVGQVGQISRPELAQRADMSKASLSPAIKSLRDRYIEVDTVTASRLGAPGATPQTLRLTEEAGYPVAIDIGHKNMRLAIGEAHGQELMVDPNGDRWDTHGTDDLTPEVFNRVAEMLDERLGRLEIDPRRIRGVGISIAAPLDLEGRVLSNVPPALSGVDVRDAARNAIFERLRVRPPVVPDNDANAAAFGEVVHGVGVEKGNGNLLYIKVSAGLGVGIVRDYVLQRGPSGGDGELGHTPMPDHRLVEEELAAYQRERYEAGGSAPSEILPAGEPLAALTCPWCGSLGCLESVASATGLAKRLHGRFPKEYPEEPAPDAIIHNALGSDHHPICRWAIAEAATYLGLGVCTLLNIVDADLVVIGGVMSEAGSLLLDPVKRQVERRTIRRLNPPEVCLATGRHDNELMGAMALVLREVPPLFFLPPQESTLRAIAVPA